MGRSGSTFVSTLLQSHPDIWMVPGEPFNGHMQEWRQTACPRGPPGRGVTACSLAREEAARRRRLGDESSELALAGHIFDEMRVTNRTGACGAVQRAGMPAPRAVGFKTLYRHLWQPAVCFGPRALSTVEARGYRPHMCTPGPAAYRALADAPALLVPTALPVAGALGAARAKAVLVTRENRLAHFLALKSAAERVVANQPLHCPASAKEGCGSRGPGAKVWVRVQRSAERPRCDQACRALPFLPWPAAADGSEAPRRAQEAAFATYPWHATLWKGGAAAGPFACDSLGDFINISQREDAVAGLTLRAAGVPVHTVSYETLVVREDDPGSVSRFETAVCLLLDFVGGLPCRDPCTGRLLVAAGTAKTGGRHHARDVLANYREVADYLAGRGMQWMLDL